MLALREDWTPRHEQRISPGREEIHPVPRPWFLVPGYRLPILDFCGFPGFPRPRFAPVAAVC
jgi:hypothetical protein